jgi:hypothetical protein
VSDADFVHLLLQLASLASSFFAAIAASFAFFKGVRNGRVVQETKTKVENVTLMINGHMATRIEKEKKLARAEGVADALQAVVEAEKVVLLRSEKEP